MEQDQYINALIELHCEMERQGPGDEVFSKHILSLLPELPEKPRIVDLGCGSGAGTLVLAETFNTTITAVDFSGPFLVELENRAKAKGMDHLVQILECDMGNLDWPAGSVDLLWSEGAAYNLTFAGALKYWRPLMAPGGIAVVSEITWFTDDIPEPVFEYWQNAYPEIASENENAKRAEAAGFKVLDVHRLSSSAWWTNYYDPLIERMNTLRPSADTIMQDVIKETEEEIEMFRNYDDIYGYSFYLLKGV